MYRLTCIVDDKAPPPFRAEHGFAVWVESPEGHVLFDTGGSGDVLLHNAHQLNLDLAQADAVVLSHAHDDHTGGLDGVLPLLRPGTPLYAHPTLFRPRYSDHGDGPKSRGIKLSQETLVARLDFRLSAEPQEVLPGIWTTGEIVDRPEPEGRSVRHSIVRDGEHVPDPYEDDFSLVLKSEAAVFLLCGCCHAGLLNTLGHVQARWPDPVVGVGGGTHLNSADEATLKCTVDTLASKESLQMAWLGHCSGDTFMARIREALGPTRFRRCQAGDSIDIL